MEPVARTASRIQGGEGGILEAVVLPDGRNELGQVVAKIRASSSTTVEPWSGGPIATS